MESNGRKGHLTCVHKQHFRKASTDFSSHTGSICFFSFQKHFQRYDNSEFENFDLLCQLILRVCTSVRPQISITQFRHPKLKTNTKPQCYVSLTMSVSAHTAVKANLSSISEFSTGRVCQGTVPPAQRVLQDPWKSSSTVLGSTWQTCGNEPGECLKLVYRVCFPHTYLPRTKFNLYMKHRRRLTCPICLHKSPTSC